MIDSLQIVLFFEENDTYNPVKIAAMLSEKIKEIGNPVVLSIEESIRAGAPFLIFQQEKIELLADFNKLRLTLRGDLVAVSEKILKSILEIFEKDKYLRIGVVIKKSFDKEIFKTIKEQTGCNDAFLNSREFKLSWLDDAEFEDAAINKWINYLSDEANKNHVDCFYDFNTKIDSNIDLKSEVIVNFLDYCIKSV